MATIIDGKQIAQERKEALKHKIEVLKLSKKNITPTLAVILIGENNPSAIYVKHKKKNAEEVGINLNIISFSDNVEQHEIETVIESLNKDSKVQGILLQLPIPDHLDKFELISKINPLKDVDGLTPFNSGRLMQGYHPYFLPATSKGIYSMLHDSGIEIPKKHIVIIGRSIIVGRPVASLMLANDATVTITHSKTENLSEYTSMADILIVAVGQAKLITSEYIKQGAVVLDVGINVIDGKTVGDVDFENVKHKASYISPVPGGVGPLTIISLLENVYEAAIINNP